MNQVAYLFFFVTVIFRQIKEATYCRWKLKFKNKEPLLIFFSLDRLSRLKLRQSIFCCQGTIFFRGQTDCPHGSQTNFKSTYLLSNPFQWDHVVSIDSYSRTGHCNLTCELKTYHVILVIVVNRLDRLSRKYSAVNHLSES